MPDNTRDKQSKAPDSPDELNGGLTGRVSGVTRIGAKAIGVAAAVLAALVIAILWGVNRGSGTPQTAAQAPTIAAAPTKAEPHFGADVPIVATPDPTEAPITLPTNNAAAQPVPNLTPTALRQTAQGGQQQSMDEQRRLRRELLDQAIHSKIIATDNQAASGSAAAAAAASNCVDAAGPAGGAGAKGQQQPSVAAGGSRDFLNGPVGQYSCLASSETAKDDYLNSQRAAPRSQYEVLAGSIIPASLISAIDSDLPGLISAQVREDVYDTKTGKYLLIPRGSRLLGLYRSGVQYGQSRVLVAWTRLMFPDTTGIDLMGMTGADVEGNAGLAGTVNNHYGKIFGAALLTSVLAAGLQMSQPQQTGFYPNQQQLAAAAAGQQMLSLGSSMASRAMGIAPTLNIPKGYPFSVMVDKDIVFPGTYQGT